MAVFDVDDFESEFEKLVASMLWLSLIVCFASKPRASSCIPIVCEESKAFCASMALERLDASETFDDLSNVGSRPRR